MHPTAVNSCDLEKISNVSKHNPSYQCETQPSNKQVPFSGTSNDVSHCSV